MRKLMIAMLALAVVFGFAACDNSNSGSTSLMDQYVVALEVTDGPKAYFEGDVVDVAGVGGAGNCAPAVPPHGAS